MMLDEGQVDQLANIEQHGATLSVNNPVSNEVEVFLNNLDNDGIESDKNLYGIQDNTVVTLSSINEFDKKKDWLAQQLVYNTSSSEEETIQNSERSLQQHQTTGEERKIKNVNVVRKNTIRELNDYLNDQVILAATLPLSNNFNAKKLRNSVNTTSMKGVLLRNNFSNSNSSIKRYSIHINN